MEYRLFIVIAFMIISAHTSLSAQGITVPVFGHIEYINRNNVQMMLNFGPPGIQIVKYDSAGIITMGIPYPFGTNPSVNTQVIQNADGIKIYPNPVNQAMTILREHPNKPLEIIISTIFGQPIRRELWSNKNLTYTIMVNELQSGFYLVQFREPGNHITTVLKMVKY
ncbi:MAG TPA: T9SS type A sorting domain-containing protein [Saprospiraceae bacterium]|nr:T9SS type A sorting domain-containing protein [Saprospiraceae bacterium]